MGRMRAKGDVMSLHEYPADDVTWDCPRCGDELRERTHRDADGERVTVRYCPGCENTDLWSLARSVGK